MKSEPSIVALSGQRAQSLASGVEAIFLPALMEEVRAMSPA